VSKIGVFGHFLRNRPLKVSNCLHDGIGQLGASFECGAILGENLNQGLRGIKCQKFRSFDIFSETDG